MTKTKMKTRDGKWFKSFDFHFNGTEFESATINLSDNEEEAMVCGKSEAKERIKTAKRWCGVELIEVVC